MSLDLPLHLGVVQPFDLRYVRDDLHAIAFFEGHAEYEAVEAMVRLDDAARPIVRAILTRHDQSQIDHVNDRTLQLASARAGRESVLVDIGASIDLSARAPWLDVSFMSHRGEAVRMRLACASPPDAARGGISDPGRHSPHGSLPIMLRGRSALASMDSQVEFDGVAHPIPEKLRIGTHFAARNGFFTLSHHMAILRAGVRSIRLLEQPRRFEPGERWVHRAPDGERIYTIESTTPAGEIRVTAVHSGNGHETIVGTVSARAFRCGPSESRPTRRRPKASRSRSTNPANSRSASIGKPRQ